MKDETAVTAACIKAINASGLAYVWRQGSGVVPTRRGWCHLGPEGIPDIIGFLCDGTGRLVAIETKTASSAPKPKKRGVGLTRGTTKRSRAEAQAEWRARLLEHRCLHAQAVGPAEALAWVQSLSTAAT